jgi:hypothetical protein
VSDAKEVTTRVPSPAAPDGSGSGREVYRVGWVEVEAGDKREHRKGAKAQLSPAKIARGVVGVSGLGVHIPLERQPFKQESASAAYSLGLSYDSRPLQYGGWRPFVDAGQVTKHYTDAGDLELEIKRDDEPLPLDGRARLRLSFAVEHTRVQRILVPLFAGGVKFSVKQAETEICGSRLAITPSRSETHALMQALASSSMETAKTIWEGIGAGPRYLARYAKADVPTDPWVSIAVGLLMIRMGWSWNELEWVESLTQQHEWISDASILAAHLRLALPSPDVDGALKHLQKAQRIGAVYFFESNRLQGELLVALAADAPEEDQRRVAAKELARWRDHLANQVQVGAHFSWLMTHGAKTRGGLDARYSAILTHGHLLADWAP